MKQPTSFRLSDKTKRLLREVAKADKRAVSAELEWLVERRAQELGVAAKHA